jgi:hypothetical protein
MFKNDSNDEIEEEENEEGDIPSIGDEQIIEEGGEIPEYGEEDEDDVDEGKEQITEDEVVEQQTQGIGRMQRELQVIRESLPRELQR